MWWTIIFRNNMVNVFSKSDRLISTSIATCASSSVVATISFAGRAMSHPIWFYWGFPMKSLKSFLLYKTHLPTGTLDKLNYITQELRQQILSYLEKTITRSLRLRISTSVLDTLINLVCYNSIYQTGSS